LLARVGRSQIQGSPVALVWRLKIWLTPFLDSVISGMPHGMRVNGLKTPELRGSKALKNSLPPMLIGLITGAVIY
jgi:hypothetical protein